MSRSDSAFHPDHLRRRRREVRQALGDRVMVLPSAPVLVRSGDSELPFRQDSDLLRLTGLEEPGSVLVLGGEVGEVLFVEERDPAREQWTGIRLGVEGAGERTGIDDVRPLRSLDSDLGGLVKSAPVLHVRLGRDPAFDARITGLLATARRRGARTGTGPRAVVDPGEILDELRLRKGPEEVAAVRRAVDVTMEGFRAALQAVRPGAGEWEVEGALTGAFRRAGARGPAFAPIVASGMNACILHYVTNDSCMEDDDLVLIDAGAEVEAWAGDLTRTVPVGGRFQGPGADLYDVVEGARAAAVEAIAPGVPVDRIHRRAVLHLLEGLVELGALDGEAEELAVEGAHQRWFPHQTSHWLGLDVHDPGDYASPESGPRILEPGMILTVEPGLYVPPPGLFGPESETPLPAGFERWAGRGIRIEDDVLVTEGGHEVLSAALPSSRIELEALLGQG
ncbi:MAG: M24 family metallopeptidase [Gemmatimonadales bacterium]|nr:MAG: M24 family metallopeptidase [Gemmatimonadales bacterium]